MKDTAYPLGQLATLIDGVVEGDGSVTITGVSSVEEAQAGHIAHIAEPQLLPAGENSAAAALIVPPHAKTSRKPIIVTEDPRLAFSKVLELFAPERRLPVGTSSRAIIGKNVSVGEGVTIGAGAFVGDNAVIGDNVFIYPLAYVGYEVSIGCETQIHPHVYIGDRVSLGERVIIHSGAAIGADGFGYLQTAEGHQKIPQIGTVIIEDDVEIGANCTVDRATVTATRIGKGTKIDDQVHVAHNVVIGENGLLCGLVGIAGSAQIGNNVMMGGQVGINDHIKICDNVVIGGGGKVYGDINKPGIYSGTPARPHQERLRNLALQRRLPQLVERIKQLEARLAELEGNNKQ